MRIRGSKLDKTRWLKAEELAKKGYTVCAGAKILGIHHATAIYIARRMGFKWAGSMRGRYPRPVQETMGRVERMMRLAAR